MCKCPVKMRSQLAKLHDVCLHLELAKLADCHVHVACAHLRSKKLRTLWCQQLQLCLQFALTTVHAVPSRTSYICPSDICPYNLSGSPMKTADDTSKTRCSNDGHHSAEANVWFEIVTIPKRSNSGLGKHVDVWINTDACPNWATTKLVQSAALWMWVNARKNRQWNAMKCHWKFPKILWDLGNFPERASHLLSATLLQ